MDLDTIARVRRAFHQQGWSVKRISRDLHVSYNTVRNMLRVDGTAFIHEREVNPMPKLGDWTRKPDRLLPPNEGLASKERLILIRTFAEIRELGYEDIYGSVCRFAQPGSKADSNSRSVTSATTMAIRRPSPSSACPRPMSFIDVGRGSHLMASNQPRSNGSTGSITGSFWNAFSHIPPAEAESNFYAAKSQTAMAA